MFTKRSPVSCAGTLYVPRHHVTFLWRAAVPVVVLGMVVCVAACGTNNNLGGNQPQATGSPVATGSGFPSLFPQLPMSLPLSAPLQVAPANGSVFSNYPRTTTLQWEPVTGAASYWVEVDFYQPGVTSCTGGAVDVEPTNVPQTTFTFEFVGAQPGCWQVWASDADGHAGHKSPWWEFSYTV
jgi:hypothetical protein